MNATAIGPRHDLLGASALALGVCSAGLTGVTFYMLADLAAYYASQSFPPSGGEAFSLNAIPYFFALLSVASLVPPAVFLLASWLRRRGEKRSQRTLFHVATGVTMLPALYLLLRLVLGILMLA